VFQDTRRPRCGFLDLQCACRAAEIGATRREEGASEDLERRAQCHASVPGQRFRGRQRAKFPRRSSSPDLLAPPPPGRQPSKPSASTLARPRPRRPTWHTKWFHTENVDSRNNSASQTRRRSRGIRRHAIAQPIVVCRLQESRQRLSRLVPQHLLLNVRLHVNPALGGANLGRQGHRRFAGVKATSLRWP
jgi:hypothetical protein